MDLILGRKDAVKVAVHNWNSKWAPAIIQLSESLTGKQGTVYKQNQMASHGMYIDRAIIMYIYMYTSIQLFLQEVRIFNPSTLVLCLHFCCEHMQL